LRPRNGIFEATTPRRAAIFHWQWERRAECWIFVACRGRSTGADAPGLRQRDL